MWISDFIYPIAIFIGVVGLGWIVAQAINK